MNFTNDILGYIAIIIDNGLIMFVIGYKYKFYLQL